MKRTTLIILFSLAVMCITPKAWSDDTNTVTDPSGNVYAADSQSGYYWGGFGTGLFLFGFGLVLRLAKRTVGGADF